MTTDDESIAELQREVARLREQVDTLYRHLGLGQLAAVGGGPDPAVVEAIRAGNIITAIKIHRDRTGTGLKEAKDQVEALARSLGY